MTTRRVWDRPPLSYSCLSYIILSHPHPHPKLKLGHIDECPSLFTKKRINSSPHYLNPYMYFCFDWKDDFSKPNNITSIHKIPNEQIHNLHVYKFFLKKQKIPQKFWKTTVAFGNKILEKKYEWIWDLRQIHTWNKTS